VNNIFVYCEIEDGQVADVSLELLTKARSLADQLSCKVEAVVLGTELKGIEKHLFPYGVDVLHIGDDKRLSPYLTLPHSAILKHILEEEKAQIHYSVQVPLAVTWLPVSLLP
jgi:electron transfer flavoprotein alpha subunit